MNFSDESEKLPCVLFLLLICISFCMSSCATLAKDAPEIEKIADDIYEEELERHHN